MDEETQEEINARMDLISVLIGITVKAIAEMRERGADSAQIARVLQMAVEELQESADDPEED